MLKNLNETELQWVVPKIEKSLLWVFQSVCQWVSDRQRASYELNPLGQLKSFLNISKIAHLALDYEMPKMKIKFY